jgi:Tfp pilus assembly protein PilF
MNTIERLVHEGEERRLRGDLDGAARRFGKAISLDRDRTPGPTTGLAHVALMLDRRRDAVKLLNRVIAAHPTSARALTLRGIAADADGSTELATELFRRAHVADPAYGPAMVNLGASLVQQREWQEAYDVLHQARAIGAARLPVPLLAIAATHCGEPEEALTTLLKHVKDSPNDCEAIVTLANLLLVLEQDVLALELMQAATQRLPRNQQLAAHAREVARRVRAAKP